MSSPRICRGRTILAGLVVTVVACGIPLDASAPSHSSSGGADDAGGDGVSSSSSGGGASSSGAASSSSGGSGGGASSSSGGGSSGGAGSSSGGGSSGGAGSSSGGGSSGGASSSSGGTTKYLLTVSRSGTGQGTVTSSTGGLDCGSTCTASLAAGTSVTLTATAASGSTFAGWSGACSGSAKTCAVSLSAPRSVTAAFDTGGDPASYQPCPATGDCRILPLGDSITDGVWPQPGGYRIELFRKAVAAGQHVTFVGSLSNGPPTVDGATFPRNHEGHSGWRIEQIAGLVPTPALSTPPHIVLLMAGTNDVLQSYSLSSAPQRLEALLDKLIAGAPNALIVVAQLTPLGGESAWGEAATQSYNAALPAIVNARAAQGKHVVLVDQHTGFPASELADGIHPDPAGYARMAGVWYAAIGPRLR